MPVGSFACRRVRVPSVDVRLGAFLLAFLLRFPQLVGRRRRVRPFAGPRRSCRCRCLLALVLRRRRALARRGILLRSLGLRPGWSATAAPRPHSPRRRWSRRRSWRCLLPNSVARVLRRRKPPPLSACRCVGRLQAGSASPTPICCSICAMPGNASVVTCGSDSVPLTYICTICWFACLTKFFTSGNW